MTVKFIESKQTENTVQLGSLKCGDAFAVGEHCYIKTSAHEGDGKIIRCMHISGKNIGYLGHFKYDNEVVPVTLVVTLES